MTQQTQPIRINPETKTEIERLMLEKMQKDKKLRLSYATFIDELVLSYKEHLNCK